jgi:hypothetical protein
VAERSRILRPAAYARGRDLGPPVAGADRPEPVSLFGSYDTFLDHARQTFNGQPNISDPSVQAASFTTTCVASGCVAHWLRLTELTENQNAPALFDYQWVNNRGESTGEYPFHCDDGSVITTTRSDSLTPNGDADAAGETPASKRFVPPMGFEPTLPP